MYRYIMILVKTKVRRTCSPPSLPPRKSVQSVTEEFLISNSPKWRDSYRYHINNVISVMYFLGLAQDHILYEKGFRLKGNYLMVKGI